MKTCHSLRAEPLACAQQLHSQRGELRHLTRLWLRHRQRKPPLPKWDTLKKHLKNNYKLLTCKKKKKINNNNKVIAQISTRMERKTA